MAVDFTAETMTNWAREELDLGDFQTELLKTGLEFGLDKGLDKVGSKHVPFTDDMTFSEAKRYNQSMQNMESGKHNPSLSASTISSGKSILCVRSRLTSPAI